MHKVISDYGIRFEGSRFEGGRLPLSALESLHGFQALIIAFMKEEWVLLSPSDTTAPRNLGKGLSVDIKGLHEGSARTVVEVSFNEDVDDSQQPLPGFDNRSMKLTAAEASVKRTIDTFGSFRSDVVSNVHSLEAYRALKRMKTGISVADDDAMVIYELIPDSPNAESLRDIVRIDSDLIKDIIESTKVISEQRITGYANIFGLDVDGKVKLKDAPHGHKGSFCISVDKALVKTEYDGKLNNRVFYDLLVVPGDGDRFEIKRQVMVKIIDQSDSDLLSMNKNRLDRISQLKEGWHFGYGEKIADKAIKMARAIMEMRPFFSDILVPMPTKMGGISFEFETFNASWAWSVFIEADGSISTMAVHLPSDEFKRTTRYENVSDFTLALDAIRGNDETVH